MSRESRLQRRAPRRAARPRLLIVCGSERTETQYLVGLRDSLDNRAVDVRIVKHPKSPAQVVAYATKIATADFDEVWCVLDVDEFDIATAAAHADEARIEVSNAVTRAKALDPTGSDHTKNPSSSMWRLVEKIMG